MGRVTESIKVSILIPLFNNEKFISEAVLSAINQTWKNIEIIIVDDGSTDSSLKIAQKYASDYVKVILQENKGSSAARNRAFSHCTGDYIQYLDSDDILAPDKIEKQLLRLVQKDGKAIASGPFKCFKDDMKEYSCITDNGYNDFENPIDWLIEAAWERAMFPPVVWLTPRRIIEEVGSWNESLSYNDDPEFFARVLLKSRCIVFCEDAVYYYRQGHGTSLGSRKDQKARISELKSLNLVTSHMLKFEDSLRVREALAYKYRKLIYSLYPNFKDLISCAEERINELGIKGDFIFGNGLTRKLNSLIGWKNAKLIQRAYQKVKEKF